MANGQVVQIDGVVVGIGATVLTMSDGAKQVAEQGLWTRVIAVTKGYLDTKGCAVATE